MPTEESLVGTFNLSNVTSTVIMMTPANATKLMALNRDNRKFRLRWSAYLARELTAGRWRLTGDAIEVSSDMKLVNGQHRLQAIIDANLSAPVTLLQMGDPDSFIVRDRGVVRTVADVTKLPPSLVADVTLLFYLSNTKNSSIGSRISERMIQDYADTWRPTFDVFHRERGAKPGMGNSSVRVGAGLRWATEKTIAGRLYVQEQYSALITANMPVSSKATASLYGRLLKKHWGGMTLVGRMATTAQVYHYFDPRRANKDPNGRTEELREEIRQWIQMMPDAFAAGPMKDGHPYRFEKEPRLKRRVDGAAAMMFDKTELEKVQGWRDKAQMSRRRRRAEDDPRTILPSL